jgi:hypothetical protein
VMFSAAAVFAAAHRILVPRPIDRGAMAEG